VLTSDGLADDLAHATTLRPAVTPEELRRVSLRAAANPQLSLSPRRNHAHIGLSGTDVHVNIPVTGAYRWSVPK
jgi:hypothetical protein